MLATPVYDTLSNTPEQIEAIARALGRSKSRRTVFEAVYHGKRVIKSVAEIAESTGLSQKDVLIAGKFLVDHHVINQLRKEGRVAYQKIGFIHKNKNKILGYVDDPSKLKRLATKRRPVPTISRMSSVSKRELKKRNQLTVLFLTASPDGGSPLRVDAEARRVQEAVRGSKFRDNVRVEYRPAANLDTILDGLNDLRPQIVHFSGHGDQNSLLTDNGSIGKPADEALPYSLLAKALAATDVQPTIVVLNSCWSSAAKKTVLPSVDFLVSMDVPITDIAAAAFAPRFYAAIASGQSVKSAFDQGAVAVAAASISEASTPQLHSKGLDPSKVVLT